MVNSHAGGIKKFQLSSVLTISITHLLHDTYSSFLAPILPLLIAKLSISLSLAGFLSVMGRLPSLFNPIVGLLADKISVRYFIIISPSITAVSMSLLGIAPSYIILALLVLIMGVSSTLFHVPAPVMIKHVSGDRVGKGMSFYMVGGELARTLGPMVILAAVSWWDLEGTFRLIPFGIIASLVLYLRVRNIRIADDFKSDEKKTSLNKTVRKFMTIFVIVAGITFFRGFMRAALTTFLPTYLNLVREETLWISGISLSLIQFSGAAGTFFSGSISDRMGRKFTLLIISVASPAFMALFLLFEGMFTIPLLILMGFSLAATTPVILAMLQELDSDRPAFINSIFMSINFLLGAFDTMLVGLMGDTIGLENTYRVSAFLAVGAVPFILKLKGFRGKR